MSARASREPLVLYRGLALFGGDARQAAGALARLLEGRRRGAARLYYLNPHVENVAWKDPELRRCLSKARWIFPDGGGVVWAARRRGLAVAQRLVLGDQIHAVASAAAGAGAPVYLWGGEPGVAAAAGNALAAAHAGLVLAGAEHGFQTDRERPRVMERIRRSRAKVVLLGMGSPLQEKTAEGLARSGGPRLLVTVGNAFAFVAGAQRRAPRWMQERGVEWLFRLLLEPGKMWRRYLVGNLLFLGHHFFQKEVRLNADR